MNWPYLSSCPRRAPWYVTSCRFPEPLALRRMSIINSYMVYSWSDKLTNKVHKNVPTSKWNVTSAGSQYSLWTFSSGPYSQPPHTMVASLHVTATWPARRWTKGSLEFSPSISTALGWVRAPQCRLSRQKLDSQTTRQHLSTPLQLQLQPATSNITENILLWTC